ncbi:transcriptional regulator [Sorangium cellulosum]|uniref:Transcriptional regulator n=1 Tax=Sorangium cellulosum TaxID=56 RepID=A0A150SWP1_SORCE|nr:transcriptional regulator [Sorangium cellulosum]KYF99076.1 transcriptional regulator [Sorangium cellulosum]
MNSSDLRVFEAVARTGGIGKAALELRTVQSNVTARVRHLEEELGVRLFERHRRGVMLTSAGKQLLPYALQVGRLLTEAEEIVRRGDEPVGTLALGSLETTAALRLAPVLSAYHRAHPRVDIALRTGTTASLTADVLGRRLEGALVVGPVRHEELVEEKLIEEELVVVAPAAWPTWVPREGGARIVVFRAGCSYRQRLEALLAGKGLVATRLLEFGTLDGILGCVAAGIGITMLPRAVVARSALGADLSIHPLPANKGRTATVFIRRRDALVSAALGAFLALARAIHAPARRSAELERDMG